MTIEETGIWPAFRRAVVAGATAGDVTVTGIEEGDGLVAVIHFVGAGTDITDLDDLTDEFEITADDTINNEGETSTDGDKLLVIWAKQSTE